MTETTARVTRAFADRYRIERELGAGGMATVYLAHDARHDRQVAIKVLHPELVAALGSERFLSEIRMTARLQHPHILPLLDSGEVADSGGSGRLLYYVMPYVRGETLRSRLEREHQLPIAEALRIAREVADALADAHAHGVIHRDIKPENILLAGGSTGGGVAQAGDGRAAHAVVADFGIALAVQQAGGQRMTQTGLSLGTPQYMAPEQAMGEKTVDARADVYALGAVTYEMLAGEPPFTGPTIQAIVAKVMTDAPRPLTTLRRSVPEHVDAAVLSALEKLPADRFDSALEFARALRDERTGPQPATGARSRARSIGWRAMMRHPLTLALGAVAVTATAIAAWQWRTAPSATPKPVVRFAVDLPEGITAFLPELVGPNVAIAPDGGTIAFTALGGDGRRKVYVRRLNDSLPVELPGTEGATQPFFSPDGRSLGFWSTDRMQRISLDGGLPQLVATMPEYSGASWSPRGVIVFAKSGGLYTISPAGGAETLLAAPDSAAGETLQRLPVLLPDGDHVAYASWDPGGVEGVRIGIASLSTRQVSRSTVAATAPLGAIDGHLIAADANGNVLAVPIDGGSITGDGVPVLSGLQLGSLGGVKAALSASGTLVYFGGTSELEAVLVNARGVEVERVLPDARRYKYPRFSPDGKRIAISVAVASRTDIWVFDRASGTPTRFTGPGSANDRPEWTPDGKRVVYRTDRGSPSSIWWEPVDQSTPATPLLAGGTADAFYEAVMTPDGKALVYQVEQSGSDANVEWRMLEGDTTPRVIAHTRAVENRARVSPDGHWVAYATEESGAVQVIVAPFPGPGTRVQVSTKGGNEPVWGADGRTLYYRGARKLIAVRYTAPPFSVTAREELFDDSYVPGLSPHANYDVTPDGKGFLMLRGAGPQNLSVVLNWGEELRARLRAPRPER